MLVPLPYDYFLNLHLAAEACHEEAAKELKNTADTINGVQNRNTIWGGSAEANQNIRALLGQYLDPVDTDPSVQ